ncbi:YoaK family protein [Leptolyngbya sp. BL0902]|uniref:YoaK family protein n=1 Tax=Leptolyngbya sp. BL0902 TaxID=1115757 RepID=UPI0018E79AF1|nr:YoaK family protein [Leptolyngbya sp. BL0902]
MVATSPPKSDFHFGQYLLSDGPAGFMLSWVAGFVDTSAFIILFGIFTAHVTGNIALAGYEFVQADEESTITHLLMFPVFMIAVAATSLLARYARHKKWPVFAILLTAEALALIIFLWVGVTLSPYLIFNVQEEYILPIGMAGVVAMAIQNALMKEAKGVFKSYIPTTVMTGNTTQLTIDLVQIALSKMASKDDKKAAQAAEEAMERMGRIVPIMIGFALGGLAATYFVLISETWWSLVLPTIVISFMAVVAFAEHARVPKEDTSEG